MTRSAVQMSAVACALSLSVACGTDEPAPTAPAPSAAPSAPSEPSAEPGGPGRSGKRGKRGGGGGAGADGCAPDKAEFQTANGPKRGLRGVVEALDEMTHGQGTAYDLPAGAELSCRVDLRPLKFYGDAIDYVGLSSDGRGLAFSAGTGTIRGIQILDLDTGKVWTGSALDKPKVDGDGIVVRNLGKALAEADWPPACDPKLKGQMSCTPWEEVRWVAGAAQPTGQTGATITE